MVQSNRKGSREWRKNIDMKDVEEYVDDKRVEEMTGGPVDSKKNEELFTIDKSGDDRNAKKYGEKKLKIDEILAERSAVPSLGLLYKKQAEKRKNDKNLKKMTKNLNCQIKKFMKKNRVKSADSSSQEKLSGTDSIPIWGDGNWSASQNADTELSEYLADKQTKIHLGFVAPKQPKSIQSSPSITQAPAVDAIHPGTSYNPKFEDHQEALKLAVEEEEKRLKERQEISQIAPKAREILAKSNLDAHATMDVEIASSEDEEEGSEASAIVSAPKNTERKTQAQRNKEKRKKIREAEIRQKKEYEANLKLIAKIRKLEKDLASKEKDSEKQAKERLLKKLKKERMQTKKLSRFNFKPLPFAVQLTEDLSESLRLFKPEINLFKDRYRSLERRNIIETRLPVKKRRRYDLKEIEKYSYKKFDQ